MEQKYSIAHLLDQMHKNWPEVATLETEVIFGLFRLKDLVSDRADQTIAHHGLTEASFEVLTTLRSLAPPRQLSPSELSRLILISTGGMTKVLKQLELDGLVERVPHATDKRSKIVKLTKRGAVKIQKVMDAVVQGDRALFASSMNKKDVGHLRDILLHALRKLEAD